MRRFALVALACCGRIDFDPLGGSTTGSLVLAAHGEHSCVLDGTRLVCWGMNGYGEVGDGQPSDSDPTVIPGAWDNVWVGEYTTCAREDGGGATWCWGRNEVGQLPFGPGNHELVPRQSSLGTGIDHFALGEAHGCAVIAGVGVRCWGLDSCGQVTGAATGTGSMLPPVMVGIAPPNVVSISAHDTQTCARDTAGNVTCWGTWDAGLADTVPYSPCGTPFGGSVQLALPRPAVQIEGGCHGHACARLDDGSVACWGYNLDGEVGDGTTNVATSPRIVQTFDGATQALEIAVGGYATYARTEDAVYAWGDDANLQLGDGGPSTSVPRRIAFFDGMQVDAISAGCATACAHADGALYCWGENGAREVGDGTTTARPTPTLIHLP